MRALCISIITIQKNVCFFLILQQVKKYALLKEKKKKPKPLVADDNCELLALPYLFPTRKFGYDFQRDIKLSSFKYFNKYFLNYTQLFASQADYIF